MPTYRAPTEDYLYLMHDVLRIEDQDSVPGMSDMTVDLTRSITDGAARLCEDAFLPLNQSGDEEGCHLENGVVRTPQGFPDAYRKLVDGGWSALTGPSEYGGADLPVAYQCMFLEMASSANLSLALYSALTGGAARALTVIGEDWMKAHLLPKLVTGEWAGTMCLTEAHCGTDLAQMKTKAVRQEDGTYRITGTKIFISGGDQDLTDNIVHMVIAKIPDETGTVRNELSDIHFFVVPKVLVDPETGELGPRNGVSVGNVEKKMGLKASSTCVMNFDNAVAYKLASHGKGKAAGMGGMFLMMNAARLGTGIQGLSQAVVALENAKAYTQERLAGRALTGSKYPDKVADPIIVHPDVRRLLLQADAFVEGARALNMTVANLMTVAEQSTDEAERQQADDLCQLLTPVIKAYETDKAFENVNGCLQVFGGHGYIREYGMEQFARDARVLQLYEGANGVQALDLVGRKMVSKGGRATMTLFGILDRFIKENADDDEMTPYIAPLKAGLGRLKDATGWLMNNAPKNFDNAGAASYETMNIMGVVILQWMWARMAKVSLAKLNASEGDPEFHKKKLVLARIWGEREVPNTAASLEKIKAGADTIMALEDAAFAV